MQDFFMRSSHEIVERPTRIKRKKANMIVVTLTSHMFNMDIYSAFRLDHMLRQAAPVSASVAFLIVFRVVIPSI